jgi:hypothetical protein
MENKGVQITGGSTYAACVFVFVGSIINLSPVKIKPFKSNQSHSDTAGQSFFLGDPTLFGGEGGKVGDFFFAGALTCSRRP